MTTETVIPRLQTLLGGVSGVVRAFDQLPGKLNAADLPAWVVVPQAAEFTTIAREVIQERRDYALLLYVLPLGAGMFGDGHNAARPFFDRTRALFASNVRLGDLDGITQADLVADSGVAPLVYGEHQYVGIEFTLRVVEHYDETFGL